MSRGKPSVQFAQPPNTPQSARQPISEQFYEGDRLAAQRIYNNDQNLYYTQLLNTPEQQGISDQATGFLSGLLPQVNEVFGGSQANIDQAKANFRDPQMRALNESYDKALGTATNAASARGVRGSVGFNKYLSNEIERNRAQGAADIEANAELQTPNYLRQLISPYADLFNLYTAALAGEQGRSFEQTGQALQGSAIGAGIHSNAQSRYAPQAYTDPGRKSLFGLF